MAKKTALINTFDTNGVFALYVLFVAPSMIDWFRDILLFGGQNIALGVALCLVLLLETYAFRYVIPHIQWHNSFVHLYAAVGHMIMTFVIYIAAVNSFMASTKDLQWWVMAIGCLLVLKEIIGIGWVAQRSSNAKATTTKTDSTAKTLKWWVQVFLFAFSATGYTIFWSVLTRQIMVGQTGLGVLIAEVIGLSIIFFIAYMGSNAAVLLLGEIDMGTKKRGMARLKVLWATFARPFLIAVIPVIYRFWPGV